MLLIAELEVCVVSEQREIGEVLGVVAQLMGDACVD